MEIDLFVGAQSEITDLIGIFGPDDTIGVDDLAMLPDRLGRMLVRYAKKIRVTPRAP